MVEMDVKAVNGRVRYTRICTSLSVQLYPKYAFEPDEIWHSTAALESGWRCTTEIAIAFP